MSLPPIGLHGAPSEFSWRCLSQVVTLARENGYNVYPRSELDTDGPGPVPDVLLSAKTIKRAKHSYLFATDFCADQFGQENILEVADHYSSGRLPDPATTRFMANILANGSRTNILWNRPSRISFPVLGDVDLSYQGKLRPADPALNIYQSAKEIGQTAFWGPELFIVNPAEEGSYDCRAWRDLTGGSAAIAGNPHMALPAGHWQIEWLFELDPENGLVDIQFVWGPENHTFSCNRPGVYTVTQDAVLTESGFIAAHIQTARPHFQGRARFRGAVITYKGVRESGTNLSSN